MRAVFDTSVFVAREQRELRPASEFVGCISAITVEELALGVATAVDPDVRAVRSLTLGDVEDGMEVLEIDAAIARRCGELMGRQRRRGRRPTLADTLIAATALEHGLPVVTQDVDFLAFEGLDVIFV